MDINECIARMKNLQKEFPDEAERVLAKGAKKMVDFAKEESPDGDKNHGEASSMEDELIMNTAKGRRRKIKNSWRRKMSGYTAESIQANIYNTAPHFHLVERGHVMKTIHGRVKGYKQGTYFFTRTVQKHAGEVMEGMYEDMFRAVEKKL